MKHSRRDFLKTGLTIGLGVGLLGTKAVATNHSDGSIAIPSDISAQQVSLTDKEKRAAFYCHLADLADRDISYRLVFNQTRNEDHLHQVVSINPDLVTCQTVQIDEWTAAWEHEHNGHLLLKAIRHESMKEPSIMRWRGCTRKCETDLDRALFNVADTILKQGAKFASWTPATTQVSFVVPLWVMEVLFVLPEGGGNENQSA